MDDTEFERKPLLQGDGVLQTEECPTSGVGMPEMFTDGDQGPINQVILSTIAPVTDDQGSVVDGSVSGTFVADASTLQNLIASGTVQLTDASGQPLQLVRLASTEQTTSPATVTSAAPPMVVKGEHIVTDAMDAEARMAAHLDVGLPGSSALDYGLLSTTTSPIVQNLPPGTPVWAARLRDCQKIGDFYRGWVETEVELDIILTLHKQHTQSMWGTRQSPCPNRPATRLMWKSQYVPFDGMPFLNAGSRAIVMECQFGPRRKGSQSRKDEMAPLKADFRQTCPARIYIKKVRKFIEYQINVTSDKKLMKVEMDRAFQAIRDQDYKLPSQERYYVQLPTQKAHEFHGDRQEEVLKSVISGTTQDDTLSRLHPLVVEKIREFVSMGETRLYVIRKQLRKFVEKELFEVADNIPDKHNLQFFPTVNDLQNHIHQAAKDIESGMLAMAPNTLNLDLMDTQGRGPLSWQVGENPHAETVTVTITQNPDGENHVISKVETHLSDGRTQVTENLNEETARLLAKVHPNMFSNISQHLDQHQPTTIRIQMPVSSSSSDIPLSVPMQSEPLSVQSESIASGLLTSPVVSADQSIVTLSDTDDQTAYTVIQDSNGALFLTKAGVLVSEEECSTNSNILAAEASLSSPATIPTSSVQDMDHQSGVLTIVENNEISSSTTQAVDTTSCSLTEVRNLIEGAGDCQVAEIDPHADNTAADGLNGGECNFTIVSDSAFHQVTGVEYPSDPVAMNTSSELDVGHLTEGSDLLVCEEVGVMTQTVDHSDVDFNIVEIKQENNSIEVVL